MGENPGYTLQGSRGSSAGGRHLGLDPRKEAGHRCWLWPSRGSRSSREGPSGSNSNPQDTTSGGSTERSSRHGMLPGVPCSAAPGGLQSLTYIRDFMESVHTFTHTHSHSPRCSHACIHTRMCTHTAAKPTALLCPLSLPQALRVLSVEGGQVSVSHTESSPEG